MLLLEKFVRAPQMFLEAGVPLKASLYLHMPAEAKMVLYRKKGHVLDLQEVMALREAGEARIFLSKDEYSEALQDVAANLAMENKQSTSPPSAQDKELKSMASSALRGMSVSTLNNPELARQTTKKILDDSSQVMTQVIMGFKSMREQKKTLRDYISSLSVEASPLATHNKHVSALAALILIATGDTNEDHVTDLVFSGLIHDLCLDQLPVIFMDRHLSGADLALQAEAIFSKEVSFNIYKRHVELSIKRVSDLGIPMSEESKLIISQHHENLDGSGVYGLKAVDIFPSARILRIADDAICLVNSAETPHTMDEALDKIQTLNEAHQQNLYDPVILSQLKKALVG